jgi:hypothetical protein
MASAIHNLTLPALSLVQVHALPPLEREEALEEWVAWLSANRHRVSATVETLLDKALFELRVDAVGNPPTSDVGERFDAWLEHAGTVGQGQGPNSDPEDV